MAAAPGAQTSKMAIQDHTTVPCQDTLPMECPMPRGSELHRRDWWALSGSRKPEYCTSEAYPVIRGSGKTPDNYTPFQWPVLSKLYQLVAKYGLGSPAVTNMLCFLTTEEVTPFDIKQLAKPMFTTVQYMVFESAWRCSAEKQEQRNLKVPQEDPHYEVGVSQLLGLQPLACPWLQARSTSAGTSKGFGDGSIV